MKTIDVSPTNPIVKVDSLFYLGITILKSSHEFAICPYDFPFDEISLGFNMNG